MPFRTKRISTSMLENIRRDGKEEEGQDA
ncbi:hypothetical protein LINPERPRIM_LOCUS21780 [Linum perenne]